MHSYMGGMGRSIHDTLAPYALTSFQQPLPLLLLLLLMKSCETPSCLLAHVLLLLPRSWPRGVTSLLKATVTE